MRICIVLLTGLGDVVLGLPIVNAIKRAWPTSHITWIVEPMPSGILRPHPSVDEVIVYHKKRGMKGVQQLRRDLAGRHFDITLNFNIYFKSVWPTVLSSAPRRIGFGRDRARDGVWFSANEHLPSGPRAHTQDMFLEFLDVLEIPREPMQWLIPLTENEQLEKDAFFQALQDRPLWESSAHRPIRRRIGRSSAIRSSVDALTGAARCACRFARRDRARVSRRSRAA
jgi:heptosyltransferase I